MAVATEPFSAGIASIPLAGTWIEERPSQLLRVHFFVRINANARGYLHRSPGDFNRVHLSVTEERSSRSQRVIASGAYCNEPVIRFYYIAGARKEEGLVLVRDNEESFEAPEHPVCPPLFC